MIDSESERKFIRAVFKYEQLEQDYPKSKDLQKSLHLSRSRISELAKSLRERGFLTPDNRNFTLTAKAYDWLKQYSPVMFPVYLPLLGEVRAGASDSDVLAVYAEDLQEDSIPYIAIPGELTDVKTFLLRVIGNSMEKVNIFEGDYVVVREFKESEAPRHNELIVTKYLPLAYIDLLEDSDLDVNSISDDEYKGPVIKHYSRVEHVIKGEKRLIHGLGALSKERGSEVPIKAIDIRPMGKVCSVYREIIY